VGEIKIDRKGRILIPAEEREKLSLNPGTRLELSEERGVILLKPIIPAPIKVKAQREEWDKEAFPDSGEATFGERD